MKPLLAVIRAPSAFSCGAEAWACFLFACRLICLVIYIKARLLCFRQWPICCHITWWPPLALVAYNVQQWWPLAPAAQQRWTCSNSQRTSFTPVLHMLFRERSGCLDSRAVECLYFFTKHKTAGKVKHTMQSTQLCRSPTYSLFFLEKMHKCILGLGHPQALIEAL